MILVECFRCCGCDATNATDHERSINGMDFLFGFRCQRSITFYSREPDFNQRQQALDRLVVAVSS